MNFSDLFLRTNFVKVLQALLSRIIVSLRKYNLQANSQIVPEIINLVDQALEVSNSTEIDSFILHFKNIESLNTSSLQAIPSISEFFVKLCTNPFVSEKHLEILRTLIDEESLLADIAAIYPDDSTANLKTTHERLEKSYKEEYGGEKFERAFSAFVYFKQSEELPFKRLPPQVQGAFAFLKSISKEIEVKIEERTQTLIFPVDPSVSSILESDWTKTSHRIWSIKEFDREEIVKGGQYFRKQADTPKNKRHEPMSLFLYFFWLSIALAIDNILMLVVFLVFPNVFGGLYWVVQICLLFPQALCIASAIICILIEYFKGNNEGIFEKINKGKSLKFHKIMLIWLLIPNIFALFSSQLSLLLFLHSFSFLHWLLQLINIFSTLVNSYKQHIVFAIYLTAACIFVLTDYNITNYVVSHFLCKFFEKMLDFSQSSASSTQESKIKTSTSFSYISLISRLSRSNLKERNWIELKVKDMINLGEHSWMD